MTDRKKTTSQSQAAAVGITPTPESTKVKAEKTEKTAKASARETTRREPVKQERKTAVRRDTKESTSVVKRLRTSRIGRFVYEAYYELRYKVTWPTLREARNMTAVVIALSAVIGLILAAADYGLHRLFLLIIGAH